MASFKLSVVAPDRTVFEDDVKSVVVPAVYGYLGIMSGHEPSLIALKPGLIWYKDESNQDHWVSISGGFLETSESSVILLAQDAVRSAEVDLAEAQSALEEAKKVLRGEASSMTLNEAMTEMEKAAARLSLASKK